MKHHLALILILSQYRLQDSHGMVSGNLVQQPVGSVLCPVRHTRMQLKWSTKESKSAMASRRWGWYLTLAAMVGESGVTWARTRGRRSENSKKMEERKKKSAAFDLLPLHLYPS